MEKVACSQRKAQTSHPKATEGLRFSKDLKGFVGVRGPQLSRNRRSLCWDTSAHVYVRTAAGGPLQWSRITSHHMEFDLKLCGSSSQQCLPIIHCVDSNMWYDTGHLRHNVIANNSGQSFFRVAKSQSCMSFARSKELWLNHIHDLTWFKTANLCIECDACYSDTTQCMSGLLN